LDYDSFLDFYRDVIDNTAIKTFTLAQELYELYRMSYFMCNWEKNPLFFDDGTYDGFSALSMALGMKDAGSKGILISVDNYGSNGYQYDGIGLDGVKRECSKYPELIKYIDFIKSDDLNYIRTLSSNSLSFAFIDSWHEYDHVKKTLLAITPKMKSNLSMLCGHDYSWSECGVVRAVDGWREVNKTKLWAFGNSIYSIWYSVIREKQ